MPTKQRTRRRSSLVLRIDLINDAARKSERLSEDADSSMDGVTKVTTGIKFLKLRKKSIAGQASIG